MSDGWGARRFWSAANVVPDGAGWAVRLDDRPIRTPAGAALVLPTRALAQMVAAEWDAQGDRVDPTVMPATRTANSALDKVGPQHAAIVAGLAEYGATDLLCYRATEPQGLIEQQAAVWDPLLDWTAQTFGATLHVTAGVMPITQDPAVLAALAAPMRAMDIFALAAFHDLVAIPGSLVLALAFAQGLLTAVQVWDASQLDAEWQASEWGRDEEADSVAVRHRAALLDAAAFHAAART